MYTQRARLVKELFKNEINPNTNEINFLINRTFSWPGQINNYVMTRDSWRRSQRKKNQ